MKPQLCLLAATLQLVLAVAVKKAEADDWPMFGRDGSRNPVSPESAPPVKWDLGPDWGQKNWTPKQATNLKWVAELGSITCGDPVVADGLVWVGTNNHTYDDKIDASVLVCFRENDGELLYKYVSPRMNHRMLDWPYSSMANSPLVEGDRLWFATNRWEAVCLDIGPLKRGKGPPRELWKRDLIKELGVHPNGAVMNYTRFSSFADYKDRLFLITGNGVDLAGGVRVPAPEAPSLVCFEKQTGKVLWTDNSPGNNILSGQWASPLVVEIQGRAQVIAPQGDGWLRAFDGQTGELIWMFDMNTKESKWVYGGRGHRNNLLATPVLYENRIYLASGQQPNNDDGPGRLCCIDPTKTGDISSELAVDAARKRLPQRRVQAVNPKKGERTIPNPNSGLVWEYTKADRNGNGEIDFEEEFTRTFCSVAIKDGLLVATSFIGFVHCIDARTGQQHWAHDANASIWAAPLIVDDRIFVAAEDGHLAVFRLSADPNLAMKTVGGYLEPIELIDMRSTVFASPIYTNGTLYIASRTHLFAIQESDEKGREGLRPPKKSSDARRRSGPRSAFVPTPPDVVEKMLEAAQIQTSDVVCDLGSGDGRIVIAAAKKYGCRAVGYEIDRQLILDSLRSAEKAGVADRVKFLRADLFAADISQFDVIMTYLTPNQMKRLVPKFEMLKPGSRIISHHFVIPGVKAEETYELSSASDGQRHKIHLWTAPLRED